MERRDVCFGVVVRVRLRNATPPGNDPEQPENKNEGVENVWRSHSLLYSLSL